MNRPIKIGIAGTHSTGKSTFLKALQRRLRARRVSVSLVSDLAKSAKEAGLPILHNHTHESTAWIIARGISLEMRAATDSDVVLVDRPVGDALAYLEAALITRGVPYAAQSRRYLEALVRLHSPTYDLILLTVPTKGVSIDRSKKRGTNLKFRNLVFTRFKSIFHRLGIKSHPLSQSEAPTRLAAVEDFVLKRLTRAGKFKTRR